MQKETSIYLDAVRFAAACLVVIYHAYGLKITGGFLWWLRGYGPTSVMVFFVLSGYVIGFVSSAKENCLSDYAVARISRLYSVVLPAIALTVACNFLGEQFNSQLYQGPWEPDQGDSIFRYFATAGMLQDVWAIDLNPKNNGSFWSLSYEFIFYVIFAGAFYLRGFARVLVVLAGAILGGPGILLMAPIWWLGFWAYRLHTSKSFLPAPWLAGCLFVFGLAVLAFSPKYRDWWVVDIAYVRPSVLAEYIDGVAFFVHLLGVPMVVAKISRFLIIFERQISFASGLTFSIYLFHMPIVRLAAGVSPFVSSPGSWRNILFVYGATVLFVLLLGVPAERSKYWWRERILAAMRSLRGSKLID